MALALCLFSACNKDNAKQEDVGGPYLISIENGYINGDKTLKKAEVEKGEEVEVKAIVPEGMKFKEWVITDTDIVFSREDPVVFKALSDRNITARFEEANPIKYYTVTIENGFLNGDASVSTQEFAENTKVVLYANVPYGKVFNGFYSNNALVSKINPYENYYVKNNATIVATFRNKEEAPEEEDQCELKIVGGTLETSTETEKIFQKGTSLAVKAIIPDDKLFDGWYENDEKVSSSATYAFTITFSRRLEARFVDKPYYTVTVVDGNMDDADGKVMQGNKVQLSAYAETNDAVFDRWEVTIKDVVTLYKDKEISLTVNSDIDAVAIYNDKFKVSAYQKGEEDPFYEGYIPAGYGSVSVQAPTKSGYSFAAWVDSEENVVSKYSKIIVQGIEYHTDIYAEYKVIDSGKTNVLINNGVAYEDSSYNSLLGSEFSVSTGTVIYVKPDVTGGDVKYNGGTLSSSNNYKLTTVSTNYEIDCTKTIPIRMFNCKSTSGSISSVQVGQTYVFMEDIDTLKNMFSDWSISGRPNLGNSIEVNGKHYLVLTITADVLNGNTSLDINMLYNAILKVEVINGTINGKTSSNVPANNEITIIADEIENKLFKEWRCNGSVVSTDEWYTFTIHNSGKFEAVYYDISTISYSEGISIITENNADILIDDIENKVLTVVKGSKISIKSLRDNFPGWALLTNNIKSTISSSDAVEDAGYYVYSFNAVDQYAVRFASANKYYVKTYNANNKGNSEVNVLGSNYLVLDSVTITANDDVDGFAFIGWQIGGNIVAENPYTFLIDNANIDAYAVFKHTYTLTEINGDANGLQAIETTIEGEIVSIEILNEDPHYKFLYWEDNDGNKIYDTYYEFELTKNITYTAFFDEMVKVTLINGELNDGEHKGQIEGYYIKGSSVSVKAILPEHSDSDGWYIGDAFQSKMQEALLTNLQEDTVATFKYIKHAKSIVQIYYNGEYSGNDIVNYHSIFVNQTVSVDDIDGYRFDHMIDHLGKQISTKSYQVVQLQHGEEIIAKAYYIKTHKVTIINGDGYANTASNKEMIVDTGDSYEVIMSNTNDYRADAFIGWYIDNIKKSSLTTYTIENITKDIEIEARFSMMYSQSEIDEVGYKNSITNVINNSDASLNSSIVGLYVLPGLADNISITGTAYDVNNKLAYIVGNVASTNKFGVNNAVIFVLDMNSTVTAADGVTQYNGKLIKEILLREKGSTNAFTSKCNGVTITSKYLWIASQGELNGCGYLNGISLSTIANAKQSAFVSFEEKICVPVNASYVSFVPDYYTSNKPNNKVGMIYVGEYADSTTAPTHAYHKHATDNTLVAWTVAYAINENESEDYLPNGFKKTSINASSEESYVAVTPDYVFYTKEHITGMTKVGNKIVLVETEPTTGDSYLYVYDNPFPYGPVDVVSVNGTGNIEVSYFTFESSKTGLECGQNIQSVTVYKEYPDYYILVATNSGTSCIVDTAYMVKIEQ